MVSIIVHNRGSIDADVTVILTTFVTWPLCVFTATILWLMRTHLPRNLPRSLNHGSLIVIKTVWWRKKSLLPQKQVTMESDFSYSGKGFDKHDIPNRSIMRPWNLPRSLNQNSLIVVKPFGDEKYHFYHKTSRSRKWFFLQWKEIR